MSVWDWVHAYEAEAEARGDHERAGLIVVYRNAMDDKETDPDQAAARLLEGRAMAERLGERWWTLFFDHWRLQILLHFKGDYGAAIDLAVRAALEARKPAYAELPQRVCLHEDLLYCHVGVDPWGNADAIRDALAFMQAEATPDLECRYCVQVCQTDFDYACGRLDDAETSARRSLALVESASPTTRAHYGMDAHAKLCAIAFRRGEWDDLIDNAAWGERLNLVTRRPRLLAEFLLWQAFAARLLGEEERARRLYHRAVALVGRGGALPEATYFDALCAYHERGADLATALKTRERELTALAGKGMTNREARAQVERCRLLARLGRLTDADLAAARAVASRLGPPAPYLSELDGLAARAS
jgi:hypothetical protein